MRRIYDATNWYQSTRQNSRSYTGKLVTPPRPKMLTTETECIYWKVTELNQQAPRLWRPSSHVSRSTIAGKDQPKSLEMNTRSTRLCLTTMERESPPVVLREDCSTTKRLVISSHERIQSKGELYSKITEFLEVATYYGDKSTRYMEMNEARSKPLTGKLGPASR